MDAQVDINVWVLEIESADPEDPYENRVIRVIDIDSIPLYNEFLSLVAYTYKNWNRIGKAPWKAFWSTKTKYSSVKPEAVCTIHKSQGLTCDTAFLCTSGMSNLDSDIIKELVYVGSTRPKHNLYWIWYEKKTIEEILENHPKATEALKELIRPTIEKQVDANSIFNKHEPIILGIRSEIKDNELLLLDLGKQIKNLQARLQTINGVIESKKYALVKAESNYLQEMKELLWIYKLNHLPF